MTRDFTETGHTWHHPDDQLFGFGGLESVEEKASEFAGRSVIRVHRGVRMNQRGEIVCISREAPYR